MWCIRTESGLKECDHSFGEISGVRPTRLLCCHRPRDERQVGPASTLHHSSCALLRFRFWPGTWLDLVQLCTISSKWLHCKTTLVHEPRVINHLLLLFYVVSSRNIGNIYMDKIRIFGILVRKNIL